VLEAARNRASFAVDLTRRAAKSKKGKVVDARSQRRQFAPGGAGTARGGTKPQRPKTIDGQILQDMHESTRSNNAFLKEFDQGFDLSG
jgi:hypothetical protein